MQWLMFQMSGVGPMFGQVGFFHKFAGKEYEDKRPRDRYVAEARRLLGVIDRQLADHPWITGEDYTIADIATFPWINNLIGFYGAAELVGISQFTHVARALKAFLARPAVVRGLDIPSAGEVNLSSLCSDSCILTRANRAMRAAAGGKKLHDDLGGTIGG